jgi:hypothetical protein
VKVMMEAFSVKVTTTMNKIVNINCAHYTVHAGVVHYDDRVSLFDLF